MIYLYTLLINELVMSINQKQQNFVDEYLKDYNATQAAIRAGYSKNRASEIGYQLLHKTTVISALNLAQNSVSERNRVTVDSLIAELEQAREIAINSDNPTPSAAVSATMGKAKICGYLVDKVEHSGNVEFSALLASIKVDD